MKKLVAVILTFLLILTGCNTVKVTKVKDDTKTDALRFSEEYKETSKDNIYEYETYTNIIDTLKSGTGIIYLGFSSCDLCNKVTPALNEVAKDKKIKKIMYYDFKDIRDNKTKEYNDLKELLKESIMEEEKEKYEITAPTIVFVKKGKIVGMYIGKLNPNSEEVLSETDKETLKNNFISLIDKLNTKEVTTMEIKTEE